MCAWSEKREELGHADGFAELEDFSEHDPVHTGDGCVDGAHDSEQKKHRLHEVQQRLALQEAQGRSV